MVRHLLLRMGQVPGPLRPIRPVIFYLGLVVVALLVFAVSEATTPPLDANFGGLYIGLLSAPWSFFLLVSLFEGYSGPVLVLVVSLVGVIVNAALLQAVTLLVKRLLR